MGTDNVEPALQRLLLLVCDWCGDRWASQLGEDRKAAGKRARADGWCLNPISHDMLCTECAAKWRKVFWGDDA